ncbi:hypothetical protein [Sphingomonas panacis]|uniref:hypothetical protein n=1 Tax=Sphingomonas panacis TaxID=1560345 RepID=UPI00123744EA|nr:hypothetical protein [Sphingomonas panacis]
MTVLKIILYIFLLLLFIPKRGYPWAIGVTVPTYAWLFWIISRPLPISDDWGEFDRFIISIALFLGIVPAFFRLLLGLRKVENLPEKIDWKPAQASCLFVLIWGVAWLLTPIVPSFVGAAPCVAAAILLSALMLGIARLMPHHRVLFITSGTALITGAIAILIWPFAIIEAAEKKAGGRPYCVVVADGSDYRTAKNLLDLTPLIMRGRETGKSAANFHGQLLTSGDISRNWSYERRDFLDKSSDHKPPHCRAVTGFARNLAWF